MKMIIAILVAIFLAALADNTTYLRHDCNWEDCIYQDEYVLEVDEIIQKKTCLKHGQEKYQLDSLHLLNPETSYEEIEQEIIKSQQYFY